MYRVRNENRIDNVFLFARLPIGPRPLRTAATLDLEYVSVIRIDGQFDESNILGGVQVEYTHRFNRIVGRYLARMRLTTDWAALMPVNSDPSIQPLSPNHARLSPAR